MLDVQIMQAVKDMYLYSCWYFKKSFQRFHEACEDEEKAANAAKV